MNPAGGGSRSGRDGSKLGLALAGGGPEGAVYEIGVLLKTLHASVPLDEGVDLLFCINPIVPVDTAGSVEAGVMERGKLTDRGLVTVLSQTFRTMIHSRLVAGIGAYAPRYPDQDCVLFEPRRDDYRMFFTNIFRFSSRRAVCEHAYRATRRDLIERREELEPILARHGIRLRTDVLEDPDRDLWEGVGLPSRRAPRPFVLSDLDRTLTRIESLLSR